MSDPTLSDIDFKNKMDWVWATLNHLQLLMDLDLKSSKSDTVMTHKTFPNFILKLDHRFEWFKSRDFHTVINDITATYNNFGKPSWLVCMHDFKFKSRNGFWIEKMSLAQSYAFIMKKGSAKVLMEVGNMFQANKTILFKKSFIPLENEPFKLFPRFSHQSGYI